MVYLLAVPLSCDEHRFHIPGINQIKMVEALHSTGRNRRLIGNHAREDGLGQGCPKFLINGLVHIHCARALAGPKGVLLGGI